MHLVRKVNVDYETIAINQSLMPIEYHIGHVKRKKKRHLGEIRDLCSLVLHSVVILNLFSSLNL